MTHGGDQLCTTRDQRGPKKGETWAPRRRQRQVFQGKKPEQQGRDSGSKSSAVSREVAHGGSPSAVRNWAPAPVPWALWQNGDAGRAAFSGRNEIGATAA